MKLYGYWRSSSAWRVRLALHYKRIAFESIPVHLSKEGGQQHLPDFLQLNPMGQVPLLIVDDVTPALHLSQSVAIVEYLEERFPVPSLLPASAEERARCRQAVEVVNSGIQPLQNLKILSRLKASGVDPEAFARERMEQGLAALEALAEDRTGPFFLGEMLSFADLFLIPQLYNARRYQVKLAPFARLLAIEHACEALPAFRAAHPEAQADAEP